MPLVVQTPQQAPRLLTYPVEVACDAGKQPVIDTMTVTVAFDAAERVIDLRPS